MNTAWGRLLGHAKDTHLSAKEQAVAFETVRLFMDQYPYSSALHCRPWEALHPSEEPRIIITGVCVTYDMFADTVELDIFANNITI